MSNERYQRGDWLMGTIIEKNEEEIIVIQYVHPDGDTSSPTGNRVAIR